MRVCTKCGKEGSDNDFYIHSKHSNKSRQICKKCSVDGIRDRRRYIRKLIDRYKSIKGCVKCGEKRYWVLDFHHIGDKKYEISDLVSNAATNKLRIEIKECIVVCANCHRDIHYIGV